MKETYRLADSVRSAGDYMRQASKESRLDIEVLQVGEEPVSQVQSEAGRSSLHSSLESVLQQPRRIRSVVRHNTGKQTWQARCTIRFAVFRHHLGEVLNSQKFDTTMGLIIIANSVNIGLELSWRTEGKNTDICAMLEHCFLAAYTVELIMRLLEDCHSVFRDPWLRFDCFLVFLGIVSQWILPLVHNVPEVHTLLMLRCARLLRLAKTVRFLMRFRELWMLVQGLAHSASTMVYTILLLFVVLYIFACLILQLLYQHPLLEQDEVFAETVHENFGDLSKTMITLLQFVSFDNIVHVYKPLGDRDPLLLAYFVIVILVVGIVIMNLVTAVIVNSSLEQAAKDKSLLRSIEEQNRKKVLAELREMFYRLDHDGSGEVSRQEIAQIAERERHMLRDLTGFDDPVELFDALDSNEKGEVGIEEFCAGLGEIAVSDSPLELKRMQMQVDHIKHHLARYMNETEEIKLTLFDLVRMTQRLESGFNSMNSSLNPSMFVGHDEVMVVRRISSDAARSRPSLSPPPEGEISVPSPRRRSSTSKAAEVARRLNPCQKGGGSLEKEEPEVPIWAQRLTHEVQELRHITESVVVSSLGELLPQTSPEVRTRRLSQSARKPALVPEDDDLIEDAESITSSPVAIPRPREGLGPETVDPARSGLEGCTSGCQLGMVPLLEVPDIGALREAQGQRVVVAT